MDKKDEIRKLLIEEIELRGFPIGFVRDYGDAGYGILANSPFSLRFCSYAAEMLTAKSLQELSLMDLACLLENGQTPKDKDWKYLIESFDEDAGEDDGM